PASQDIGATRQIHPASGRKREGMVPPAFARPKLENVMFQHRAFFLSCALSLSLVACGEDDKPAEDCGTMCAEESLEVVGEWDTKFGTSETITETTWGDFQNVVFFDND